MSAEAEEAEGRIRTLAIINRLLTEALFGQGYAGKPLQDRAVFNDAIRSAVTAFADALRQAGLAVRADAMMEELTLFEETGRPDFTIIAGGKSDD